jgi:hypothetical protein
METVDYGRHSERLLSSFLLLDGLRKLHKVFFGTETTDTLPLDRVV